MLGDKEAQSKAVKEFLKIEIKILQVPGKPRLIHDATPMPGKNSRRQTGTRQWSRHCPTHGSPVRCTYRGRQSGFCRLGRGAVFLRLRKHPDCHLAGSCWACARQMLSGCLADAQRVPGTRTAAGTARDSDPQGLSTKTFRPRRWQLEQIYKVHMTTVLVPSPIHYKVSWTCLPDS